MAMTIVRNIAFGIGALVVSAVAGGSIGLLAVWVVR